MKFNKPRMIRLKSRLDTSKERISKVEDPSELTEIKRCQWHKQDGGQATEVQGTQQRFRREQSRRGRASVQRGDDQISPKLGVFLDFLIQGNNSSNKSR